MNICFDCGLVCFGMSCFGFTVLCALPFLCRTQRVPFALVILAWQFSEQEWLPCSCIRLGSLAVVATGFCIPCGHISSLWGMHPSWRKYLIQIQSLSFCCHSRGRDKPQTANGNKETARARRTIKAKLFQVETKILASSTLTHPPSVIPVCFFLWIHSKSNKEQTTLTYKCKQQRIGPTNLRTKLPSTHTSQRLTRPRRLCSLHDNLLECWGHHQHARLHLSFTHLTLNFSIKTFKCLHLKMTLHFRHRCIFHYVQ